MLQRLLKRSQEAVLAYSPQAGVLPNVNGAGLDELAILGGRQSIINPRSASPSPAAQPANSSSESPGSSQPNYTSNSDVISDAIAPTSAFQNDDCDTSIFFANHGSRQHQQIPDWSSFDMPSAKHELNELPHTGTYTQNSSVDQSYGHPEQGYPTATIMGTWSMFANQLLP